MPGEVGATRGPWSAHDGSAPGGWEADGKGMKAGNSRALKTVSGDEYPTMKKAVKLSTIALTFLFIYAYANSATADIDKGRDSVTEEIWALEQAYFANLYHADYNAVLAMVHSQFLGWPSTAPQPIDKEGSARFMKQLISKPTPCTFKIERGGIRMLEEVALTQYTLHVNCGDTATAAKPPSSRISHTWVKEGGGWKLLGGMSYDQ